ncbi:MAG TPA: peptidoglycan-binding protein [Micavibrio sp.]|nr:peptidoglycan-binding protein [Micavibrio sp.]
MIRFSKSALLLGAALAVLSACSGTKGPGEIGTKEDIVVRNNGLPGSKDAKAPPPNADFSSSVEQAEAISAPAVETAQPLPDSSPAVEDAAQKVAEANAPLPSAAATTPVTTPTTEGNRINQVVPQTPVQDAANIPAPAAFAAPATPAAAPAPTASETVPVQPYAAATPAADPAVSPSEAIPVQPYAAATTPAANPAVAPAPAQPAVSPSSIYPAADYAAAGVTPPDTAPVAPASAPAPVAPEPSPNAYVPVPAGTAYPLDPNAPYSPKAMAAATTATAATPAAPVSANTVNYSDPAIIRAAQTALKAKGAYTGEATGSVDAAFLNALVMYQNQNKLPVGALNEETLRNLGVVQ